MSEEQTCSVLGSRGSQNPALEAGRSSLREGNEAIYQPVHPRLEPTPPGVEAANSAVHVLSLAGRAMAV
jgi:hypothetical protein